MKPANPSTADGPCHQFRFLEKISEVSSGEWDALFNSHYPFLKHAYLLALEESASADEASGWRPRHLLMEQGDQLIAALVMYEKTHSYGEFVFDWAWADAFQRHGLNYYPKWVSAVPFTPAQGPRIGVAPGENAETAVQLLFEEIIRRAEDAGISSWHLLFPAPQEQAGWQALGPGDGLLEREDVQFHWQNRDYASFDDFLLSLRASRRKNIRRERRRVKKQGVQLERILGTDINAEDWTDFYRCYMATFLKRSGHAGYLTRDFFRRLRADLARNLMLVIARRDGMVVASALFLFDDCHLYGRWWGALEEVDCLHFEACFYQGIEFAIERGLTVFDPGTQGEHKLLRGFYPTVTRSFHWVQDARFRSAIADFLSQEKAHRRRYGEAAEGFLPYRRDLQDDDSTAAGVRPDRGARKTSGSS